MSDFVASPERLITGALLGFAVLLFLIIKVKVQPFIAIMSSALIIGLVAGMPFDMITDTLAEGVGTTLQTIAILIGLGSMFGAILQVSGGVEVIADTGGINTGNLNNCASHSRYFSDELDAPIFL